MRVKYSILFGFLTVLGLVGTVNAQQPAAAQQASQNPDKDQLRPSYVLAPNDQIIIRVPQAEEINEKPFRIDEKGFIDLPLLGRVQAAGLTLQALEQTLTQQLSRFVRQPQVMVTMVQFRSELVFLEGAFKAPGIYPLEGRRSLSEVIAAAGGLALGHGRQLRVTRRAEFGVIELPGAIQDAEKNISTVDISLAVLRQNINPPEDILLRPFDIIALDPAESVYVSGDVTRPGSLDLGIRENLTVTKALSMAGGLGKDASAGRVRILRPVYNSTQRTSIEVNAKAIFEGKANDFPVMPDDVVYVPKSTAKQVGSVFLNLFYTIIPYAIVRTIP